MLDEVVESKGGRNDKPTQPRPEPPIGQGGIVNGNLTKVKTLKLVVASTESRVTCSKCKAYFDTKQSFVSFKCTMCGTMNTVTEDMVKKLKNVHIFDVDELKVIEEGEENYVAICKVNSDSKVKTERIVL